MTMTMEQGGEIDRMVELYFKLKELGVESFEGYEGRTFKLDGYSHAETLRSSARKSYRAFHVQEVVFGMTRVLVALENADVKLALLDGAL